MTLKPYVLARKCPYIDHAEEVSLAWLNGYGVVLGLVHKGGVWDRLGAGRVSPAHKLRDKILHLIMVPVRHCQNKFFIIIIFVREVGVMNDKWSSETIWVLTLSVRMIPVGTGLINLCFLLDIMIIAVCWDSLQ